MNIEEYFNQCRDKSVFPGKRMTKKAKNSRFELLF